MKIRIAGTEFSLNNKSFEIYIQGCYRNCKGCHNPDTHSFIGGEEVDIDDWLEKLKVRLTPFIEEGLIERIYVSGGDLLCWNETRAKTFSDKLASLFINQQRWLFTGAEEEELPKWVWWYYNIVKCGRYREDLRNPEGTFPASSNQKLLFFYKLPNKVFEEIDFRGEKKWN